ncbi:MAG: hypothetical protein NZ518_10700, partial [Dehalococcoidia bacterium]|nr:hypothetical protein [Dehalococcoidia bacterium]
LGGYAGQSGGYTLRVTTTIAGGTPAPSPGPWPSLTPVPSPSVPPVPSPTRTPITPPYQAPRPLPPGQGNGYLLPPPPSTGVIATPPIQTDAGPVVIEFGGVASSGVVSVSLAPISAIVGPAPIGPALSPVFQIQTTVAADRLQICLPSPRTASTDRPVAVLALVNGRWTDVTHRHAVRPGSVCATIAPSVAPASDVGHANATTLRVVVVEQTEFPTHIPIAVRSQSAR